MNKPMSFGRWVLLQTKRDDAIGELARFAEFDMATPTNATGKARWIVFLDVRKADMSMYVALDLAFGEFERGEGFPAPAKSAWKICHLDRKYARSLGDPVLAEVDAGDQREALTIAMTMDLGIFSGLWAYQEV